MTLHHRTISCTLQFCDSTAAPQFSRRGDAMQARGWPAGLSTPREPSSQYVTVPIFRLNASFSSSDGCMCHRAWQGEGLHEHVDPAHLAVMLSRPHPVRRTPAQPHEVSSYVAAIRRLPQRIPVPCDGSLNSVYNLDVLLGAVLRSCAGPVPGRSSWRYDIGGATCTNAQTHMSTAETLQ